LLRTITPTARPRQAIRERLLSSATSQQQIDYYKLLGIPYSATAREITRAYRDAMKATHPDRVPAGDRIAAEERAKLLNLAWRTLSRPDDKARYDQTLRVEMVQEQVMSRYFGGMGIPGEGDARFGEALRREQTEFDRHQRRTVDRGAVTSVLLVFAGVTALVVCLIVVWAAVYALVRALL
jgi:DnaJ-class molecular chaperone